MQFIFEDCVHIVEVGVVEVMLVMVVGLRAAHHHYLKHNFYHNHLHDPPHYYHSNHYH